MNRIRQVAQIFFILLLSIIISCNNPEGERTIENKYVESIDSSVNVEGNRSLLKDFIPLFDDGDINVAVEIPAGTLEKWEVDKFDGKVKLEYVGEKPRIIKYLGYPGNYGMIPRTILSKELGGDGDPLDVIVLGPPVKRGSIIKCKIIGVLYLIDRGEKDDKLIAVMDSSPLYKVNSLEELNNYYNGISEILQLWFTNYKGPGKMESGGFGDRNKATEILELAIEEYQVKNNSLNIK